jgi:MFS family permease
MKLAHHISHNLHHYFKSDLSKIESFVFIHNIGRGLISIFLPIIFYMEGFSVSQILFFFLCYGLFDVILNFVAREFTAKFGAKSAIVLGLSFEILYFIGLIFLQISWGYLIVLAFLSAMYDSFFWVAHWLIFNEAVSKSKEVGKKIGMFNIIKNSASLITPLIGAMFLILFDKNYLLMFSIILFLISLIPLFRITVKHLNVEKRKNVFQMLKDKKSRESFILLSLLGVHYQVEDILLPLFIYLTFSSIENVGILPIILAAGSMIFNYFIGKFVDRHEKLRIIFFGALALSIVWLIRLFFPFIETFFLSALFVGFFTTMIFIPVDSKLIKSSGGASFLDVSTQRNTAYMLLNAPVYLILLLSVEVFKISFVMSSFAMFCLVLISQLYLRNKIKDLELKNSLYLNKNSF